MTRQNSITHHTLLTTHRSADYRAGAWGKTKRPPSNSAVHRPLLPAFRLPPSAFRSPPSARRGVLLLVVLILLVMFVMMAVTYVLVATRQLSISKAMGLKDATGDPPSQVLDGVMMQLVRDTTNKHSVLYSQSLLEHMYGPYTAVGTISSIVNQYATNQILEFNASLTPADPNFTLNSLLLSYDGYLEGCAITMTSGQAKGMTSRIVRYDTKASPPVYHVLAFKSGVVPAQNDTFLINGRAFSGTGFGLNASSGVLDARDGDTTFTSTGTPGKPFALLPNPVFYNPTKFPASDYYNSGTGVPFGGLGGGNTDYDAPDYQHMFMSWSVIGTSGLPQTILPSFHRPDLINYWSNQAAVSGNWLGHLDLLRQVMLRPMGQMSITPVGGTKVSLSTTTDHPNFTGSNPNFDAINGPWDVDNDGDGVADSVWIDAGYPVQMRADGKLYKPLVAILCVDLDGRLNVNAAGTTEQVTRIDSTTGQPQGIAGPFAGTNGTTKINLLRGEGLGPAEDDLTQFYASILQEYSSPQLTTTQAVNLANPISALLQQGGTINSVKYDGRYGDSASTAPQAGVPNQPTLLGEVMRFQYPRNTFDPTANNIFPLSSFATPSDLWGRMAVGLDYRGQPLFWKPQWTNETKNDPYDMNLSMGGSYQAYGSVSADNPFGVFDLERVLRPFDVESGELPTRLWDLSAASSIQKNPSAYQIPTNVVQTALLTLGRTITTDSWDTPSPGVVAPDYLRDTSNPAEPWRDALQRLYGRRFATNVVELLAARLAQEILRANPTLPDAQVQAQVQAMLPKAVRQLLSPELIAGLRININRPLGDGRDGNGTNTVQNGVDPTGVVDAPTNAELATEGQNASKNPWSWLSSSLQNLTYTSAMPNITLDLVNGTDVNGDGKVDQTDQLLARQLLARHLYVLARLMLDDNALQNVTWFSNEPSLTPPQIKELAIRRIAQWAVNVVDFMDPDNIMTPFEYDLYPFTNLDPSIPTQTKNSYRSPPYDANACWAVDGIVDGATAVNPQSDDSKMWRGLVWGCERPELLLNETIAFHDRRVKDSQFDRNSGKKTTDNPNPDPTFDQVRIPQGLAIFELYCTGNANQPQQSGDLYFYDNTTSQWYLDLAKLSPQDASGKQFPVWRMAITGPNSNEATPTNDIQNQLDPSNQSGHPATYSFDSDGSTSASLLPTGPNAISITPPVAERVVWFTNMQPTAGVMYGDVSANQIYYRHDTTAPKSSLLLGCGQYAVVGPRQVTRIGWTQTPDSNAMSMYADPGFEPSCAKIELNPGLNGVLFADQMLNAGGDSAPITNYPDATMVRPPLAIIAAADVTTEMTNAGWTSAAATLDTKNGATAQLFGVGISISEPLPGANYYQVPTVKRSAFDGEPGVTDCYGQPNEQDPTNTGLKFLDQPEDSETGKDRLIDHLPKAAQGRVPTGTYIDYKTVLLQRLANPLIPYDSKSNPYLTVDWMPIDLTVFNGQWPLNGATDPDELPSGSNAIPIRFASRQRNGKLSSLANAISDFNVWYRGVQKTLGGTLIDTPPVTAPNDNSNAKMVFPHILKYYDDAANPSTNSLADASNAGRPPVTPGTFDSTKKGLHTFGFVDSYFQQPLKVQFGQATQKYGPLTATEVNDPKHVGDPRSPFPWLVWNNRPYESVSEMMMVPASHPGRLLNEFSMLASGTGAPYTTDTVGTAPNAQLAPFGHLLNFFSSTAPGSATATAPGLSQMLEYLTVPSPFVGTQTVLNPQTFAWSGGTPGEAAMGGGEPNGTAGLHPPFNMVSNYREPGKVNINTISDASVWNAVLGGTPNYAVGGSGIVGPVFKYNTAGLPSIEESRRGFPVTATTSTGTEAYTFDSNHPSIFSNPFRSAAGADMVPLTGGTVDLRQSPTNASLWRATGVKGGTASFLSNIDSSGQTLISVASTPGYIPNQPADAYRNATNNAYFNYQVLDRVTGKLTTHSNVYAVWITLGYFEATPWYGVNTITGVPNTSGPQVFDTAHPDGYQLGAELGSDTGQIERHRAFYIIDRSIPVGYQHGLDNNVNNAVLLKRFIE